MSLVALRLDRTVGTSNRCAIYPRVNTDKQVTENQEPDVDRIVASRGFELVARYAAKQEEATPSLSRLQRRRCGSRGFG